MLHSRGTFQELGSTEKLPVNGGVLVDEIECSGWEEEKQKAQHGHPRYQQLVKKITDWCDVRNERQREELIKAAGNIQESRKQWEHCVKTWKMATDMAHLRKNAWARGTDVPGWEKHPYFSFELNRRYAVEATYTARATLGAPHILDFCTTEGRAEAIEFVESGLDHQEYSYDVRMEKFRAWEKCFNKWMNGEGCRLTRAIQRKRLVSSPLAAPPVPVKQAIQFRLLP